MFSEKIPYKDIKMILLVLPVCQTYCIHT